MGTAAGRHGRAHAEAMSYGDPDPAREGQQTDDPEQDAARETEETGEVNPSGLLPEGDPETETPV
jgi:hypothetical protein